jgi:arsenic resistance protein ArsH
VASDAAEHNSLPALQRAFLQPVDLARLEPAARLRHAPRILLLYGSLRPESYSRRMVEEAACVLNALGAETRIFHPHGLPVANSTEPDHPKVAELRGLSQWSEGQVWCSPERHGAITGVFKNQIDWIPLSIGRVRPTQGRALAVMQVNGGSQSFNAVNTLRLLGRWMRMFTIPNQSSVPKVYEQFDESGRMRPGPYYERVVDVREALVRFTWLLRDRPVYPPDRYTQRLAAARKAAAP